MSNNSYSVFPTFSCVTCHRVTNFSASGGECMACDDKRMVASWEEARRDAAEFHAWKMARIREDRDGADE